VFPLGWGGREAGAGDKGPLVKGWAFPRRRRYPSPSRGRHALRPARSGCCRGLTGLSFVQIAGESVGSPPAVDRAEAGFRPHGWGGPRLKKGGGGWVLRPPEPWPPPASTAWVERSEEAPTPAASAPSLRPLI